MTADDRMKSTARSTANIYQRRGRLVPQACQGCGAEAAEKHHPDYAKPLTVIWLCRPCHRLFHELEAA